MSAKPDCEDAAAAKDVLAAEEFAVPAPDPALHPERLELPSDLVGGEPRDVLVAEEFAMPAPDEAHLPPRLGGRRGWEQKPAIVWVVAMSLPPVLLYLCLRRRRHSRSATG